jgi:hypothetical protein
MFGPPEGRLQKPTCTKQRVVYPRVVHLPCPSGKLQLNPRAAITACANKLDNMEPYERIPMLTHTLRFIVKLPDGQTKANRSYPQETLR